MSLTASVCLLLSEWLSFLMAAITPRSRRTFVEFLIGCMLNPEGWVTLALVVRVSLGSALTMPIGSWLVEEYGQRGKLWVARPLIDSVRGHVKEARLLIDAAMRLKTLPVWK